MKTQPGQYYSDSIHLEGLLHLPDDFEPSQRRPAIIICSDFQGLKEWVPSRG